MTVLSPLGDAAAVPDAVALGRRARVAALVRLGRPRFLLNSLLLVTLGTAAAADQGQRLVWSGWVLAQGFAWCTHLVTHYCNEYFDLEADLANTAATGITGGSRVLCQGLLPPQAALSAAFVLLFADLALVVAMPTATERALALLALALAWFYTAPPVRLNYRALGEVGCAAVLNVLWPLLACLLQHARAEALAGPAIVLFVIQTARMTVMNLADHDSDRATGKTTLAITLGPCRSVHAYAAGQVAAYTLLLALGLGGQIPLPVCFFALATVPLAVRCWRTLDRTPVADRVGMGRAAVRASTHISTAVLAVTAGFWADGLTRAHTDDAATVLVATAATAFTGSYTMLLVRARPRPAPTAAAEPPCP